MPYVSLGEIAGLCQLCKESITEGEMVNGTAMYDPEDADIIWHKDCFEEYGDE